MTERRRFHLMLGLSAFLLHHLAWSAFLWTLGSQGYTPSGPLVIPVPRERYYALQAAFGPVVSTLALCLSAWLLGRLSAVRLPRAMGHLGFSIGVPGLLLVIVPEVIAFGFLGFSAVSKVAVVALPSSFMTSVALLQRQLVRDDALPTRSALWMSFATVLAFHLIGSPFLR